jgi:hypothetical protein
VGGRREDGRDEEREREPARHAPRLRLIRYEAVSIRYAFRRYDRGCDRGCPAAQPAARGDRGPARLGP